MIFSRSTPQSRMLAACALLAAITAASPAHADIYKCLGDNSQPVYQDNPCRAGRELRDFQADPATVSVIPFVTSPSAPAPAATARKTTKREQAASGNAPAPKSSRARGKQNLPAGDASERRFLHAGMSEAEVIARIGAPDIRSGGSGRRGGARWSYLPTDGDPGMITTLHFQAGEVTQIDRKPSR
ncbi:MAG: DUF4124 domain-containing protein [Betaproteobacteria bacterium]